MTCPTMAQSSKDIKTVSPAHETPLFISEPLELVCRSESDNKLTHVLYSALAGTAWSKFRNLIIISMHS